MYKKIVAFLCAAALMLPTCIYASDELYLGGDSIGIQLNYNGVMITGTYPFIVDKETYDPSAQIQPGDILVSVNQVPISSMDELYQQLSAYQKEVNEIPVEIQRGASKLPITLKTTYDASTRSFKSGLYVKDKIVGVGTLTYYDPSNNTYGALGLEIMDSDLKQVMLRCHQAVCIRLMWSQLQRHRITFRGKSMRRLTSAPPSPMSSRIRISVFTAITISCCAMWRLSPGRRHDEVHTGDAVMYTVLQGKTVEAFTIHITKVHRQNTADVKGIEFKIDDEKLASASNGIVQGMSGSPIVQDGKIIGAVTHVITSHPSNGYGVFIEWMLQKSRNIA